MNFSVYKDIIVTTLSHLLLCLMKPLNVNLVIIVQMAPNMQTSISAQLVHSTENTELQIRKIVLHVNLECRLICLCY